MPTKVLDRIDNKIGTFVSADVAVPSGVSSVILAADMPTAELSDPTDTLKLGIEACFDGVNFRPMAWSPPWTGAKGRTAPTLTWPFNPASPPKFVRGVLVNVTQTIAGLTIAFA